MSYVTFGATERGPGHIKSGIQNQDYFLIKKYKAGTVLVVSDGVGSCSNSHLGSRAVCRAVTGVLHDYMNITDRSVDIKDVLRLIHAKWLFDLSPLIAETCCATVLFALVQQQKVVLGRLGDGMICVGINGKDLIITEDKQDSFSNITQCMRYSFKYENWEIQEFAAPELDYILLATDGISDDISVDEKKIAFSRKFAQSYLADPSRLRTFRIKKMLKSWPVPHHSDDKTVACIVRSSFNG